MQDVPKIVRARLPVTAEAHPDADLLTAFAEQSLAGRERDSVVEHLARCSDCREVVALALPATEAVAAKSDVSARSPWLSWPVLRWGVVAVGLLAVTSVGVLQFRQSARKTVATSLMTRNEAAETVAQSAAPVPPASASLQPPTSAGKPTETAKKVARAQSLPAADKLAASPSAPLPQSQRVRGAILGGGGGGASRGAAFGGSLNGLSSSRRDSAFAPAVANTAPAAAAKQDSVPRANNETVEVSSSSQMVTVQAAPQVATDTTAQNQYQGQLIQNQSADQAQPLNGRPEAVVRAKTSPAPALLKSLPRWTISSTGTLQRSLDGGQTWLDVNIAVDTSTSLNVVGRSMNEVVTVDGRSQTTTEMKSKKKSSVPAAKSADAAPAPAAPTIFRALSVSSNAAEVWAGGSGGALFHTIDGGTLWLRVVPAAAGVALTGDIVGIQFADPRNGTITTSNAEIWTTSDDGQTWHKQQ